jgi:O-succinylbenzoic acid--CoA ligase
VRGADGASDLLARRAATTPEREAIRTAAGASRSFAAYDARVDRVAAGLDNVGVAPGDRVAVTAACTDAFATLVWASWRVGASVVPLPPDLPAARLRARLDTVEPALLVTIDTHVGTLTDAVAGSDEVGRLSELAKSDGVAEDAGARDPAAADAEALVVFTSGTTGEPTGVRLTHGNLLASARGSVLRLGTAPGDRWLACLPTHHMGGFAPIVRTVHAGSTLVCQRAFDAEATADRLDAADATGISLVPPMLERLLDDGWTPPATLETVLLGGDAASQSLLERARNRDVPVYPTYGATEAASQVATATPAQTDSYEGTVGQPLLPVRLAIRDGSGAPVETGTEGRLHVGGPTVAAGYLDDERTAAAFADGWFATGDLGYRDDAGRLWVTGRADDRIVSGGKTIDPATVESGLQPVDGVEAVAGVGIPDETWGERVGALVVGDVDLDALREHARTTLADAEVPRVLARAEALPRTPSGTVDREAVRKRLTE